MWASCSYSELNEGGLTVQFPSVYTLTLKHYFWGLETYYLSLRWSFQSLHMLHLQLCQYSSVEWMSGINFIE